MKKPRFFVGVVETGTVTLQLSRGLRALGYPVTNVIVQPFSPLVPDTGYDRYVKTGRPLSFLWNMGREWVKAVSAHDVFVFNYCTSFAGTVLNSARFENLAYIDLPVLKALGKKIVVISNGDDLRSYTGLIGELEEAGLGSHAEYIKRELTDELTPRHDAVVRARARVIERYADCIFAKPDRAQFLTRGYFTTWPGFDLSAVEYTVTHESMPVVVHAPSYRRVKGTKYVLEAVQKLEREGYRFRFLLCEDMPNEAVRKVLTGSDIVVDQLLLPGYGLLSIEAMAAGNAVLGGAVAGFNRFPEDLPIVTTTPGTVYANLKHVLDDVDFRVERAEKGREYVEKYHEYRKVARNFLRDIGVE